MTVFQHRFQHAWIPYQTGFNYNKPGRWTIYPDTDDASELWTFLRIDLEYERERVARCLDAVERFERGVAKQGYIEEGYAPPGVVSSGNDGAVYYGNGHVLIASDYEDNDRVLMTSEQFKRVLQHVLKTMDHPDYRNPDTEDPFEPLTIEIITDGEAAGDEYYKRGGITPAMPEGRQ